MFHQDSRIFPLFITCIFLMVGCETKIEPSSQKDLLTIPPPLQVAICDLDEIAKELGLIDELNRVLSRERTLLDNEIRKIQATRHSAGFPILKYSRLETQIDHLKSEIEFATE